MRVAELDAICLPPAGWRVDRADQTDRYVQRVWVSPTGKTSYGVIRFALPLPLGEEIALRGFLAEMKRTEGEARLISKVRDRPNRRLALRGRDLRARPLLERKRHLEGLVTPSPNVRLTAFVTRGLRGWAIYAGTLRLTPIALDELELAVQARDNTTLGPSD